MYAIGCPEPRDEGGESRGRLYSLHPCISLQGGIRGNLAQESIAVVLIVHTAAEMPQAVADNEIVDVEKEIISSYLIEEHGCYL